MIYIENLNGLGLKPTTKFVLYTILKRASFENKNKIQMTYSYIARQTELSRSTVLREIEFLINSEYIKSERGLFKTQENVNRVTHEITLTEKSIAILNAEASKTEIKPQNKTIKAEADQPQTDAHKTSNKPQNKPINTEPRQPQAETEKTQNKPQNEPIKTAPKQTETEQADKAYESETEQTGEQAFQTEIEKMNAMYKSLNKVQRGCATALKRSKTDNPVIYVREAQEQGVPQVLIDFILRYNKMRREEQNNENI